MKKHNKWIKNVNKHIILRKLWRCWKPNCPKKTVRSVKLCTLFAAIIHLDQISWSTCALITFILFSLLRFSVTTLMTLVHNMCPRTRSRSQSKSEKPNNWTIDNWKQNILIRSLFGRSFAFLIRSFVSSLVCFEWGMENKAQNAEKITLNYIKKNSGFLIYCIWLRSSFPSIRWNVASLLRSPPEENREIIFQLRERVAAFSCTLSKCVFFSLHYSDFGFANLSLLSCCINRYSCW